MREGRVRKMGRIGKLKAVQSEKSENGGKHEKSEKEWERQFWEGRGRIKMRRMRRMRMMRMMRRLYRRLYFAILHMHIVRKPVLSVETKGTLILLFFYLSLYFIVVNKLPLKEKEMPVIEHVNVSVAPKCNQ